MIYNLEKYSLIIIVTTLICLFIITLLTIKEYKKSKKITMYSYKNVSLLGGSIFLSLIFLYLFIMVLLRINFTDKLLNFISNISSLSSVFLIFTIPFTVIFFSFMLVSNLSLMKHEGKSIYNLLGATFSSIFIIMTLVFIFGWDIVYQNITVKLYSKGIEWINVFDIAIPMFFTFITCYLEFILLSVIIYNIKAIKYKPEYNKDYVIILGCGISKNGTPLPLLKGRIDRAIKFSKEQEKATGKKITFIASGGQGSNEIISEGLSIKNYLIKQGIDEKHILVDDKSVNTLENMKFSKKLIKNKKIDNNVIYSTTNYHVFRSGIYANMVGLNATGIGAKTKWYFWPNASIREFIALLENNKKNQIKNVIIILIISIIVGYLHSLMV